MQYKEFLIKYSEIGTKGKNRYLFEDALVSRINAAIKRVEGKFNVSKENGRIYVETFGEYDYDELIANLQTVFGVSGICPMIKLEDKGVDDLKQQVVSYFGEKYKDRNLTFKVDARRARKNYPLNSMELNADIGEALLDAYPELKVDVHKPQVHVYVEIRNQINVYSEIIPGPGGMPVGTAGRGMLLISGGIDSPVAGYMMSKRGVELSAVYFNTPPYTSERAKQKVLDLAKEVSKYSGPIRLHIVPFTDVQMYIFKNCPHEELTIIMKRCFYKIAEALAVKDGATALITGESVGQVSSQTMQSLYVINSVVKCPVLRPVVAFDKQDIIDIAEKIGTYEISIRPYEDCCTTFVAKHPVTKPSLQSIEKSEEVLVDMDKIIAEAIENTEVLNIEQ